jgi:hypothetical protein
MSTRKSLVRSRQSGQSVRDAPMASHARRGRIGDRMLESKLARLADVNPGAFYLVAAIIEGALSAGPPDGTKRDCVH